jgi:AraC family transcriptional regulator, transcriptional activator of pobA
MLRAEIPSFFLYGEPPRRADPQFVHVEDLDHRSRPSGWNIRAHAHADLHHLFLIQNGAGRMQVDTRSEMFRAPAMLLIPAGAVHSFAFETETSGLVLTLSSQFFAGLCRREPCFGELFTEAGVLPVDGEAEPLAQRYHEISRELAWLAPGHVMAIEAAVTGVVVMAVRRLQREARQVTISPGKQTQLVARFRALIEARWNEHISIPAYAVLLGVSESRLRAACVAVTGDPPMELIQERLLLEAKRLLIYTGLSVADIADALGYDPAYFSRIFSRRMGESPRRFRDDQAKPAAS